MNGLEESMTKRMIAVAATVLIASLAFAGEVKLGKPLTLKQPVAVQKLLEKPDAYVGKTVQVKGKVTDVCQKMGCWMMIADPDGGKAVRIKVEDGVIVFPKDAPAKTAIAEGKFTKRELTKEQAIAEAQHKAEANGRKFDPSTIKSGVTVYQIEGTGAVLQ